MAHLAELTRPLCKTCNAPAVFELYNRLNARVGTYCKTHGPKELKAMQQREAEAESTPSSAVTSKSKA